mgnify:CR=1 FL=1
MLSYQDHPAYAGKSGLDVLLQLGLGDSPRVMPGKSLGFVGHLKQDGDHPAYAGKSKGY